MTAQERKKITVEQIENMGWDERIKVFRCAPVVDAFAVVTQRYVVLIDTLINPRTASQMMGELEIYLEAGRLLMVVNTHADWDHVWGNQLFSGPQAVYPAPVIGHHKSQAVFNSQESKHYLKHMQDQNPGAFEDVQPTPPNLLFTQQLVINGGDLTLEIFPSFGHTVDHCSVYIPEINTLIVGDAAETPYPTAREPALFSQLRQSLQSLAELKPDICLYCHAPGVHTTDVILDNIAYFNALENACREALAVGKIPDKISEDTDLSELIGCRFEDVIPSRRNPAELHAYYRTQGHQEQILRTLEMLRRG